MSSWVFPSVLLSGIATEKNESGSGKSGTKIDRISFRVIDHVYTPHPFKTVV